MVKYFIIVWSIICVLCKWNIFFWSVYKLQQALFFFMMEEGNSEPLVAKEDKMVDNYYQKIDEEYKKFSTNFVHQKQLYPGVFVISIVPVLCVAVLSFCSAKFATLSDDLAQIIKKAVTVDFYDRRQTRHLLLSKYGGEVVNETILDEDETYEQPIWGFWLDCMGEELCSSLYENQQILPGIYVQGVQFGFSDRSLSLSMCFLPPTQNAIREEKLLPSILHFCRFMGFPTSSVTLTQLTLEETLALWENQSELQTSSSKFYPENDVDGCFIAAFF